jgi:hypothetical protein
MFDDHNIDDIHHIMLHIPLLIMAISLLMVYVDTQHHTYMRYKCQQID